MPADAIRFPRKGRIAVAICAGWLAGCAGSGSTGATREQVPGYRVYVTNEATGDLSVIDPDTFQVATFPLGKRPRGIHGSPDGLTIYVALSGSPSAPPGVDEKTLPPPDRKSDGIGIFDVRQNKIVRTIQSGQDPEQFAVSKDGRSLYISNEDGAAMSVADIASGSVTASVSVGEEPEGVAVSPDGGFVYVTSEDKGRVYVIETATNKLVKSFKAGLRPRAAVFLPDGSKAYVSAENSGIVTVVDAAKHTPLRTIALAPGVDPETVKAMGLALSPDASRLYVSTGRFHKVFVLDTATDKVIDSFDAGERPWGIGVSPDGKTLYTANGPSNDVSVIDLASRSITRKVKANGRPWGILVTPVR